ncbi:hypothetical protein TNCV_3297821 [Trichonephila clavipes]|uniref:Uncharacterized protein n=1 Tax=Trichonephila clavipes TaxID=2585209 RepID=A0A8X6VTF2_TRICX|nr:hypothetical protein TNCV_3297821 [Trichonephila clavipes]
MTPPKRGKFPKNIPYHDVFMGTLPSSRRGKCVTLFGGGPSESVQEFAARINKLGTQIFQSGISAQNTAVRNANDQLLQSRFISGLRNDIRRFVLSRDPLNLEESINAALIEEQNMKLNQIASEERSCLSSAQTENPVLSALADRLQEINLRVGRLQEASAVTARKSGGKCVTLFGGVRGTPRNSSNLYIGPVVVYKQRNLGVAISRFSNRGILSRGRQTKIGDKIRVRE